MIFLRPLIFPTCPAYNSKRLEVFTPLWIFPLPQEQQGTQPGDRMAQKLRQGGVFLPINVLVLLTTIENHLVENQRERDRTWNSVLVIFFLLL